MTAFVSGHSLAAQVFSRRPRAAKCHCFSSDSASGHSFFRTAPKSQRAMVIRMGGRADAELSRQPEPGDLNSGRGFALQDAPSYQFNTLSSDIGNFEKGGAYAIRNAEGQVCYMGYSKNIAAKLLFHSKLQPERCSSFQVYVPPVPPELISPEMLESVLEYWVRENGGVPTGNTVDRALWEQSNPTDRKSEPLPEQHTSEEASNVPIRERTTARRVSTRRDISSDGYGQESFVDGFRSTSGPSQRRRKSSSETWGPADDDYVEVDADPLDPFSASRRRPRTSWDYQSEDDEIEEDWIPIAALMGCAGLIWLLGFLTNALPAATPSLGM